MGSYRSSDLGLRASGFGARQAGIGHEHRSGLARDYNKLEAFHLADDFAVLVYEETRRMPDTDNIRTQLRRAAISAPQNICEGCARRSSADYARFLDIALSSATEAVYVLGFSKRGLLPPGIADECRNLGERTIKALQKLLDAVEQFPEQRAIRRGGGPAGRRAPSA